MRKHWWGCKMQEYGGYDTKGLVKVALLAMCLLLAWGGRSPALSELPGKGAGQQGDLGSSIRITSDAVESDHQMKWLEFTGNVRATQENGVITADRIKVFYKSHGRRSGMATTVEKIISEGNVKIVLGGKSKTAVAEKAIYTADPKVLVLSGGGPTVWSGDNVIRGEKITLFLAEDRTLVEGGEGTPVDATFFAEGEKGLAE
ncbi:MAG: LptA/OstA family protein [Thermodesulfobacteriota bacterium]|nr:LptA/OstA family protein [Thermodesulfobacteriota bacterium]